MPVHKRSYRNGKIVWYYAFPAPGSTRADQDRITESGFATKDAAQKAEAARRIQIQNEAESAEDARKREAEAAVKAKEPAPLTLGGLLAEFFADCGELAPKTLERYRELAAYLHPDLLAMAVTSVSALDLHREWKRLAESGGRHRKTKEPRPLKARTVRHVCGVVSSAFGRAQLWEIVQSNPATVSRPPKVVKHEGIALMPDQTRLMAEAATIPWLPVFLELDDAAGCRRGELLALEWSNLSGSTLTVARSLGQVKANQPLPPDVEAIGGGLYLKSTKTGKRRTIELPPVAMMALAEHRKRQDEFREQFGPDYTGDLIFANPDGSPLKPDSVSSAVSLLCRRLKLPKGVSLHTLRHTHGSQLLAAGIPVAEVARRLGHTPETLMRIYAHAIQGAGGDEKAVKAWEEFQKLEPSASQRKN
jgi:integrase